MEFDYIIIGAGASGCVLANRLTQDPATRVLLIEAGGANRHPFISMPKGISRLSSSPDHAWRFSVEQPREEGVPWHEVWVRGKGLGGSTAINGMIYSRGHPLDYEHWSEQAGSNWGWAAMKAAFRAIEDHELGATEERGGHGPLHVGPTKFRYPIAQAMIRAGEQLGLPRRDDLNNKELEGVGYYNYTIKNGRRVSAATAFLDPIRHRKNLVISTDTVADRILFVGSKAVAVACRVQGRHAEFRSKKEIIVAAGTIMSPKLLQLSGVGPARHLRSVGVDVVYDSPDVGRRMREHVAITMQYRLEGAAGLNRRFRGAGLGAAVMQYYAFHNGPLATGPYEVGAFIRSSESADRPDIQLYLGAFSRQVAPLPDGDRWLSGSRYKPERSPGISVHGMVLQPTSEGSVLIASSDPDVPPAIAPNWLSTEADRSSALSLVRLIRRYLQQPALTRYVGEERLPGTGYQSDDAVLTVFRKVFNSGLHAVGSCRMGQDSTAVLDDQLRVRGVENLRVVDCSSMPGLISGNTAGPAMAFAWRAADLILKDRQG